jgi:hypothetical protein
MTQRLLLIGLLLLLLLPACQQGPSDGKLTVAFPTETTERAGGGALRVTIALVDNDNQPVTGATVQAELRAPNGSVFATLPCADTGQGRYLADYVSLPLKGSKGTWRVVARATWAGDKQAQGESTFKGLVSPSEDIQNQAGCWVEMPKSYDCGDRDLVYKVWHAPDGTGYVLINNHCHGSLCLNVYWQRADFPADEAAASAHARPLAAIFESRTGAIVELTDVLEPNLAVERATFKGQPAWHVSGEWKRTVVDDLSGSNPGGSIEWMILRCPGSNYLWTVAIATTRDGDADRENLRTTREKFECPTP